MNEGKIQCHECQKYFTNIGRHLNAHDLTSREYQKKYSGARLTSEEYDKKQSESMLARYQDINNEDLRKKVGKKLLTLFQIKI